MRLTSPVRATLGTLLALSTAVLPACAAAGPADPGGGASATAAGTPSASPTAGGEPSAGAARRAERRATPALRVRRVVTGLAQPWDVAVLPGGDLLVTERDDAELLLRTAGSTEAVPVDAPLDSGPGRVWVSGETGLMSLALSPDFATDRRFFTCQGGFRKNGSTDVRVVAWRLAEDRRSATVDRVLLRGIPTTSGRHGGCRLLVARDGSLLVGTGDAADERHPQDRGSLAGKVLRLDPATGAPWPGNPFASSDDREQRYVLTYGHRNVQGLAQRADGTLWSAEHGPDRDDEVNLLRPGGNYGWDPGPGYDESVPMTDRSLPGRQIAARWSSGVPTIASSGATWVRGRQWGGLRGTLAVAALKTEKVVFLRVDDEGRLRSTRTPAALREFGRLRSIEQAPDGALLITTANGAGDSVLRVSPR